MSSIAVEFDGRIAAVARDETGGQYQDAGARESCIDSLFRPGRTYGANSTVALLLSYSPVHPSPCLVSIRSYP